jgi:hypothetical protein
MAADSIKAKAFDRAQMIGALCIMIRQMRFGTPLAVSIDRSGFEAATSGVR